jgi:hypothetical protein
MQEIEFWEESSSDEQTPDESPSYSHRASIESTPEEVIAERIM